MIVTDGRGAAGRGATGAGPGAETAVRLVNVHKAYGSGELAVRALRGISLDIQTGQFVVLLGPSGSGKTTLMNVVGGMEPASSGLIEVAGRSLADLDGETLTAFRRESVGFVFQFFNLIPTLTALENVQLVAELGNAQDGAATRAIEAVGLAERADHFPGAMSGGEQQRVAIARAVVKDPPILLCDEPTGSLDLDTGRQVLGVLRDLSRAAGRTVLLVTHNSAIAAMADRVIRLRSGEVVDDRLVPEPIEADAVTW